MPYMECLGIVDGTVGTAFQDLVNRFPHVIRRDDGPQCGRVQWGKMESSRHAAAKAPKWLKHCRSRRLDLPLSFRSPSQTGLLTVECLESLTAKGAVCPWHPGE